MSQDTAKDSREALREEILKLIRPYANAKLEDIPFSVPELIVIAVAGSHHRDIRSDRIASWIISHFTAYEDLAKQIRRNRRHLGWSTNDILVGFSACFYAYNIPLRDAKTSFPAIWTNNGRYTVDVKAARVFLRNHIGLSGSTASLNLAHSRPPSLVSSRFDMSCRPRLDFFSLPPEIRLMVYEYVFSYSPLTVERQWRMSGRPPGSHDCLWVYTKRREHDRLFDEARFHRRLIVGPLRDILALARANKQLYLETSQIFYKVNTFRIWDPVALRGFICETPAVNLAYLSNVSLMYHYSGRETEVYSPTFTAMLALKHLNHLIVDVLDQSWVVARSKQSGKVPTYNHVSRFPRIRALVQVLANVKEVEITGEGGRVKEWLFSAAAKQRERRPIRQK